MPASSPRIKFLLFIITLLLITNIGMLFFYVKKSPNQDRDKRDHDKNATSELFKTKIGFTESQLKQYDQLRQEHREKIKPLFDSIRIAKEDFYKQLNQPSVNDSLLNYQLSLIGERQQLIDRQVFNHFRTVREVCTPEQQVKFDSLINGVIHKMIVPWRRGDSSKDKKVQKEK